MPVIARAFAVVFLCAIAFEAMAATQVEIDQARNKGLAWFYVNQKGDGSWKSAGGLQTQSTAAALEALLKAGITRGRPFAMAQSWLANADQISTDSISRQCIALYRSGSDVTELIARLTAMRHLRTKSWGAYDQYYGSFPDTSLALDALAVTNTTYPDTISSLGFITGLQNTDGGWSFTTIYGEPGTSVSRVIPTAHNIATLSRYKTRGWNVDASITNGVNWLVARHKSDGGFTDDLAATIGAPYETALVYLALIEAKNTGNAAAIASQAVIDNAQDFLIDHQQVNGSWSNDPLATALALQTFPAVTLTDTDKDGIPDPVEAVLLTNPSVADGRNLAIGNGDAEPGINASVLLATIPVNRSFSMSLPVSGGTAPYTWSLLTGNLPGGLSLGSSTGVISGAPTATGTYNFSYKVSDSAGLNASTISQIIVNPLPVMVTIPSVSYFETLQSAYNAQPENGEVTFLISVLPLNEDFVLNREVSVLLRGGYNDIFTSRAGFTTLTGSLTIIGGSLTADGITIK